MSGISRAFNYILYFLAIVIIFSFIYKYGSDEKVLPVSLWYVYSESMEPVLLENDGFILITSKEFEKNDVITFKPKYLNQPYVTHRIVGISEDGSYITKGDNNPMSDQQGGEPSVCREQIIGKAVEFNNSLIVLPRLGTISNKIKSITKSFNIFVLFSIAVGIVLVEYLIDKMSRKKSSKKRKQYKLLDIAQFLDYSFILFIILAFLNALFIGITLKGWNNESFSYVVVSTEGLLSPMPGEKFSRVLSMENRTFIPFITVLGSNNATTEIDPELLILTPGSKVDYKVTLIAPDKLGYYTEQIDRRTYPGVLPQGLFDLLYYKHKHITLLTTFLPGILLMSGCYIWWMRRWRIGRREVMPWLLYLRNVLRSL